MYGPPSVPTVRRIALPESGGQVVDRRAGDHGSIPAHLRLQRSSGDSLPGAIGGSVREDRGVDGCRMPIIAPPHGSRQVLFATSRAPNATSKGSRHRRPDHRPGRLRPSFPGQARPAGRGRVDVRRRASRPHCIRCCPIASSSAPTTPWRRSTSTSPRAGAAGFCLRGPESDAGRGGAPPLSRVAAVRNPEFTAPVGPDTAGLRNVLMPDRGIRETLANPPPTLRPKAPCRTHRVPRSRTPSSARRLRSVSQITPNQDTGVDRNGKSCRIPHIRKLLRDGDGIRVRAAEAGCPGQPTYRSADCSASIPLSGGPVSILGLCKDDPLVKALREVFGANIIRVPEQRYQPLTVVAAMNDKASFRGALARLIEGEVEMRFDPALFATSRMANIKWPPIPFGRDRTRAQDPRGLPPGTRHPPGRHRNEVERSVQSLLHLRRRTPELGRRQRRRAHARGQSHRP